MIYLNTHDIEQIKLNWIELISQIEKTLKCLDERDFSQPIKPYVRYRDMKNRIIAMPAFVGGGINAVGIKWIASYPQNIDKGIPRAHSILLLNDVETGEIIATINSSSLSIIRTATVSATFLYYAVPTRSKKKFNVGIIGFGPIGQAHLNMIIDLYKEQIANIYIYDLRSINHIIVNSHYSQQKVIVSQSWEEVYAMADILFTCTTANQSFIDQAPKQGSLILNVSLRDFHPDIFEYVFSSIVIDDWDEVCRENTLIENMQKNNGLTKDQTISLSEVILHNKLAKLDSQIPVIFCPMGLAVFDIAIGSLYLSKAIERNIGTLLN